MHRLRLSCRRLIRLTINNTNNINNKLIGQRIRKERCKLNLTREEFAEIVGLSDFYIGQLERGERQMSLPAMVSIASHLHISLDYLIWGKNEHDHSLAKEPCNNYGTSASDNAIVMKELHELLSKCSLKELKLICKMIKTIIPYIRN